MLTSKSMFNTPTLSKWTAAALLCAALPVFAASKPPKGSFDQVDTSNNLSQLIRSNAPQYWDYLKKTADLKDLKPYISFTGIVAGDPHLGNFSALPLKNSRGNRQMRFVDVDFDDAGEAPFALDYARYIISVKAFSTEIKNKEMQAAYLDGLDGKQMKAPSVVQKLLDMSVSDYDKLAADYVAAHTTTTGFKMEAGKGEPLKIKIDRSKIAALFPGEKVIDVAARPKDRGGSVDQVRIWVLVEGTSDRRIMELKERAAPGVEKYQSQPDVKTWIKDVHESFWPGLDGSAYDLVNFNGGTYWLRQKEVSLIDVPYSSEKAASLDYVHALALYDANLLGLIHGQQSGAKGYKSAIAKDPDTFHDAIKALSDAYLDYAKKALDGKN